MKKYCWSLIVFGAWIICGCAGPTRWELLQAQFPDSTGRVTHFVAIPSYEFEQSASYRSAARLDTDFEQQLEHYCCDTALAAFRVDLDGKARWGLVCHMPPGEASSYWGLDLLIYDAEHDSFGAHAYLAYEGGECQQEVLESWLLDLDADEKLEIVSKILTYNLKPCDLDGAEDDPFWMEYDLKAYEINPKGGLDQVPYINYPNMYAMDIDQRVREMYRHAGRADLLPKELR